MTSKEGREWFLADLHDYTRMVWLRMTEFGIVIQVREKHVSRGSATPPSQGVGPKRSPKF